MAIKYQWKEHKFRNGSVEYKYMCPLMRGEHRPTVLVMAGDDPQGHIYATAISGYTRRFDDLDKAKAYVSDVPMKVCGFIRDEVR